MIQKIFRRKEEIAVIRWNCDAIEKEAKYMEAVMFETIGMKNLTNSRCLVKWSKLGLPKRNEHWVRTVYTWHFKK